jgi:ATP adenylyltransferase
VNVGVNIGRDAGAGVEGHLHIHLVPRWQGDTNFLTAIGKTRVLSEALEDTFDKMKKALESI